MEGSGESILFVWVLPRSFLVLDLLGDVEGISTSVGVLELRRLRVMNYVGIARGLSSCLTEALTVLASVSHQPYTSLGWWYPG